ncbi:DgyrCDS14679 [Dimorphilus gyrociliatus]|uniref:DgyrCDS14679 n=1 Tax=Dimorphilus gyrociliatus TaxID=2664684 RepID=A0A7I8WEI4_9ANNE|nr:DgyrCDS14679 [Dimorphilus gyrociliatus]
MDIIYNYIKLDEDIAHSRDAYQRTTHFNDLAINAVEGGANVGYARDRDFNYGWWTVDLNGYYRITEMCFYNREYQDSLRNFLVYTENQLHDNNELCINYSKIVTGKSLYNDENFHCELCNCTGNFVFLQQAYFGVFLIIEEVRIRGNLIRDSDEKLLSLENTELFISNVSNPNVKLLTDRLYTTFINSGKYIGTQPFIRIDLLKYYEIRTILIDRTDENIPTRQYFAIFVSELPFTCGQISNKYLLDRIKTSLFYVPTTYVGSKSKYLLGRYVLIKSELENGNLENYLPIANIFLYRKREDINLSTNYIHYEQKGHVLSKLKNDIPYLSGSIQMKANDILTINTIENFLDVICITFETDNQLIEKGVEMKFFNERNTEALLEMTTNFEGKMTNCGYFLGVIMNKLTILAKYFVAANKFIEDCQQLNSPRIIVSSLYINNTMEIGVIVGKKLKGNDVVVVAEHEKSNEQCFENGYMMTLDDKILYRYRCLKNIISLQILKIDPNIKIEGLYKFATISY